MRDYKLTDPEFAERFEHFAFEIINLQIRNLQNGLNILLLTKLSMKRDSSLTESPATWLLQPH